jgi:hypothetical protein
MSRTLRMIATISALAAVIGVGGPTFAAKPPSGISGTIALDQGAGLASTASTTSVKYGDTAHFKTSVQGRLATNSMLYVTVVCVQGSTVVYQASADPSAGFTLQDQPGQGLDWNGQQASCSGSLVYREQNGKNVSISYLDSTSFTAG